MNPGDRSYKVTRPGQGWIDLGQLVPAEMQYTSQRGDVCVQLMGCWKEILGEMDKMGPIVLVTRNAVNLLASMVAQPTFAETPGSEEIVELSSGLIVPVARICAGIVLEEHFGSARTMSLQFFDSESEGLLKVLLTHESDFSMFADLVRFFGCTPRASPISSLARLPMGIMPADPARVARAWESEADAPFGDWFDAETPRLKALQAAEHAARLAATDLIPALLARVQRWGLSLQVTSRNGELWHEHTGQFRQVEVCRCAYRAFSDDGELHFFRRSLNQVWICQWPSNRFAVEVYDEFGRAACRLAPGKGAGELQVAAWAQFLSSPHSAVQ
jgi:putative heme degradation protein